MSNQDNIESNIKKNLPNVDTRRRQIAKAGLATPILYAITSRNAIAGCALNSGSMSPGRLESCGVVPLEIPEYRAESAGYWKDSPHAVWPNSTYHPFDYEKDTETDGCSERHKNNRDRCVQHEWRRGTKFCDAFELTGCIYGDLSMHQVMHLNGEDDPTQLGFHAAGALLNAAAYPGSYPLSEQEVISLYQQHCLERPGELKQLFENLNNHNYPFI